MRARPSRAVSLLVTSVILTGLLIPGAAAQQAGEESAQGSEVGGPAVVDLSEIPAEPPCSPPGPPPGNSSAPTATP